MQYNDDEIEIDLKALFFELLDQWKVIALSTFLVAAIFASVSIFLITPKYSSTAEIYVLSKSTSITSLADIQVGSNLSKDYQSVITSRVVLERVIDRLDLVEDYKELGEKLSVANTSDRILSLTITDTNAQRAKIIADEMADVVTEFIAEKMDQSAPTILSYGYVEPKKVSPSNAKNTIMGALLGFLLACAVVVVAFLLNDTIMSTDDVEKRLGITVLGTVPLEDSDTDDGELIRRKKSKKSKKNKK